jgi:hypothetical protein
MSRWAGSWFCLRPAKSRPLAGIVEENIKSRAFLLAKGMKEPTLSVKREIYATESGDALISVLAAIQKKMKDKLIKQVDKIEK